VVSVEMKKMSDIFMKIFQAKFFRFQADIIPEKGPWAALILIILESTSLRKFINCHLAHFLGEK